MLSSTQLLVRTLLLDCHRLEWSIQGLGMLRAYLSKEVRLHIWNPAFAVPNVSTIHSHPWDFVSEVVVGAIENQRYSVRRRHTDGLMQDDPPFFREGTLPLTYPSEDDTHLCAILRCGPGGGLEGGAEPRLLKPWVLHSYGPGESYDQRASEVHETRALPGTVTLITRRFLADTEHARVYFPLGTEWVSAEPRPATTAEVQAFVEPALALLEEAAR